MDKVHSDGRELEAVREAVIVTGAHTHNFDDIVTVFVQNQAIIQLPVMSDGQAHSALEKVFRDLLADKQRQRELGQRAKHLVEQNQGSTERTLDLLSSLLVNGRPSTASSAGD